MTNYFDITRKVAKTGTEKFDDYWEELRKQNRHYCRCYYGNGVRRRRKKMSIDGRRNAKLI